MSDSSVHSSPTRYGATLNSDGVCFWCVWAPHATTVELVLFDADGGRTTCPMGRRERSLFTLAVDGVDVGQRYAFSLGGGRDLADPASRWQPDGVHAPSAVWDPQRFHWSDLHWQGIPRSKLVIYELHVGTFTPEGTFAAIIPRLEALFDLGITAIELMPVGQFPGRRNWGYDGIHWFAAQNSYGGPAELQRLVDACHAAGLAVILDVIYNHVGPEGNYLAEFGPYFTDHHHTPWGIALNYDDRGSDSVRDFVLQNVRQWIRDFRIDGLRLDAIHAICDDSPRNLLAEIKWTADDEAERRGWPAEIIAESCLNDVRLLQPVSRGGYGLDAQWNDDFHHAVHTLLTGERNGYYADFDAPAIQLAKAMNDTFVFDGCYSRFRDRRHGAPADDLSGDRFIISTQTHDQIGNRARGDRLTALLDPPRLRLAAALLLLSPYIPMLFMGEEYGESNPFPFFCDFEDPGLQAAVRRGRHAEFAEFAWGEAIPDPQDERTFLAAKLTWTWPETTWRGGLRRLYQDLLAARRVWPALQDFQHRKADVVFMSDGTTILQLVRGDPSLPVHRITACFNLGSGAVPWPAGLVGNTLLLSSESERYCGNPATPENDVRILAPYECIVLRPTEEDHR